MKLYVFVHVWYDTESSYDTSRWYWNVTNHRNCKMYDSKDSMNDNYDANIKIGLREVTRWNI